MRPGRRSRPQAATPMEPAGPGDAEHAKRQQPAPKALEHLDRWSWRPHWISDERCPSWCTDFVDPNSPETSTIAVSHRPRIGLAIHGGADYGNARSRWRKQPTVRLQSYPRAAERLFEPGRPSLRAQGPRQAHRSRPDLRERWTGEEPLAVGPVVRIASTQKEHPDGNRHQREDDDPTHSANRQRFAHTTLTMPARVSSRFVSAAP
jgi:hypothetical protein